MKELYVIYRLENEICDDSYVNIINVYNDIKLAEKEIMRLLEDDKQMLKIEFAFTKTEFEHRLSIFQDEIGLYKYKIDLEDKIIEVKIQTIEKEDEE